MTEEKLLTIRDAALILGVSEKEIIDLAESGAIPAYKIGGVYLRFKRQQIEEAKKTLNLAPKPDARLERRSWKDGFSDFFYFNDFYIISILMIALILWIIFKG